MSCLKAIISTASVRVQVVTQVYTRVKFIFNHGKAKQSTEDGSHINQSDTRLLSRLLKWPREIKDILSRSKKMQDSQSGLRVVSSRHSEKDIITEFNVTHTLKVSSHHNCSSTHTFNRQA